MRACAKAPCSSPDAVDTRHGSHIVRPCSKTVVWIPGREETRVTSTREAQVDGRDEDGKRTNEWWKRDACVSVRFREVEEGYRSLEGGKVRQMCGGRCDGMEVHGRKPVLRHTGDQEMQAFHCFARGGSGPIRTLLGPM